MLFNNPLSVERASWLIDLLDLSSGNRVLDAGCGRGEFLIRVVEASRADGLGIDRDAASIEAARASAASRLPDASCEFRACDARNEALEEDSFDAAVCLGSTHAFGSGADAYPNAIEALRQLVRPGGRVLLGEGYWKRPPDPEYLELLGEPVGIYHDHFENVAFAEQHGLVPLYAAVSNLDEWDHFEWSHHTERRAELHPDDPETPERLRRIRAWRNGYLRWGRSTMGFGFYLFRRP